MYSWTPVRNVTLSSLFKVMLSLLTLPTANSQKGWNLK